MNLNPFGTFYGRRTLWGLTWVGWLNILFLQFFFLRLTYTPQGVWGILIGAIPLTGWWTSFYSVAIHKNAGNLYQFNNKRMATVVGTPLEGVHEKNPLDLEV